MKHKIKRLLFFFIFVFALFNLAACKSEEKNEVSDPNIESLKQVAPQFIQSLSGLSDEQISEAIKESEDSGNRNMVAVYQNYYDNKKIIGDITGYDNVVVTGDKKDGYVIHMDITGSKRDAKVSIILPGNLKGIDSLSFVPNYSIGEKMANAGFNTLMGMGVVFVVLIFIAFLISLFKYISIFEKKFEERKAKTEDKEEVKETEVNEVNIVNADPVLDDEELIAVITASIAAYESENTTNGLTARSFKRKVRR